MKIYRLWQWCKHSGGKNKSLKKNPPSKQTKEVKLCLKKIVNLHVEGLKTKALQSHKEMSSFVEVIVRTQRI